MTNYKDWDSTSRGSLPPKTSPPSPTGLVVLNFMRKEFAAKGEGPPSASSPGGVPTKNSTNFFPAVLPRKPPASPASRNRTAASEPRAWRNCRSGFRRHFARVNDNA